MAAVIIDGKALAAQCKAEVTQQAKALKSRPGLAVILVGDDPASRVYVTSKRKDCEECGFYSEEFTLPPQAGQKALLELVDTLNERPEIDGILCQLPLPQGYDYDEQEVLLHIDPAKDVDAFQPTNVGKIMIGNYDFLPCTPAGVMEMLDAYGIDPAGKHCVVVGRSNIVGKPQAMLLLHRHGTVTICHSKTPNLAEITRQADILVAAVGRVGLITADMVKPGAVVIDVAMNRNAAGKLCGDVDFAPVSEVASYITPVPGGVGPMTRAMLMKNTLTAARLHGK
jgi:methylenetetrahydrofolate dehydrogenase (NADP+)/methenyltetrahydrofolate cyclohydrolase